ncbi:MAG: EVE domain-containing protein [Nitrospiraceae bacterium]
MSMEKQYWLVKSEPNSFSIHNLEKAPKRTTCWDGVRNYQARNYMRQMKVKDLVLFYHSNTAPPAVVGVAEVVRKAYPDHTAFDPQNAHYDPRSDRTKPVWEMVDIRLVEIFSCPLSLDQLRQENGLKRMELLRRGSRLSVQPVTADEWKTILRLAKNKRGA